MQPSPESHSSARQTSFYTLPAAVLIGRTVAVTVPVAIALYLLSRSYFLFYHTLVEFFVIVVAFTIFSIGWNARYFVRNNSLLLLAVGYLALCPIQFFHEATYLGINVLPVADANPATQLWIAGRYLEALIFIAAALLLGVRRRIPPALLMGIALSVSMLLLLSIWPLRLFPDCFVAPGGLTPFKIVSEYVICALFGVSMLLFWQRRSQLDRSLMLLLQGSLGLAIAAELSFTLYQDVYGFTNFLGHFFKLASVVLLYRALISGALRAPYSILFSDLARAKEALDQELEQRRQSERELREANQELDAFVRTVSHDLRSPLTPIVGLANYLQEQLKEKVDRDSLTALENIEDQGRRMVRILEDLLTFARAGHLDKESCELAPLDDILDGVLEDLGSQLIAHKVTVTRSPLPDASYPRTQLFLVFSNLLSNALKYAAQTQQPIEVRGRRLEGNQVHIEIVDHGPGIPAHERENIFEIFYRQRCHENMSGTGIGLATVKKIIDRLGGTISVGATPGGGATFTLVLPPEFGNSHS